LGVERVPGNCRSHLQVEDAVLDAEIPRHDFGTLLREMGNQVEIYDTCPLNIQLSEPGGQMMR